MSYETASTSDEGIQIGSAVAAKIELTVKRIDELFENTEIPIEIGLKLPSGKYEYIPLGFLLQNIQRLTKQPQHLRLTTE